MMQIRKLAGVLILMLAAGSLGLTASAVPDDGYLGRWDIVATQAGKALPINCWLEVRRDGANLVGRFNPGQGAALDLAKVSVEAGELRFQYSDEEERNLPPQVWRGNLKNERLHGTAVVYGKKLTWSGVRGPAWPSTPLQRKSGTPVDLFNGKDVSNWLGQDPKRPLGWSVKDGVMVNTGKGANNIYTRQKFNDFQLDVEFNVAPQSNSGVYLRGRYEIQVLDGRGRPLDVHSQGALYGFIVPPVNADKPAGEWQTYKIMLIANRVTVVLNGATIIDNGEVPGITGGALDSDEKSPGPIMLQGDHGKVQYRKVRLTPLE
jgi:hypothetical protein